MTRVLGVALVRGPAPQTLFTAEPATQSANDGSVVSMQKARLAWDSTRKAIQSLLKALEGAILAGVKVHNEDPSLRFSLA